MTGRTASGPGRRHLQFLLTQPLIQSRHVKSDRDGAVSLWHRGPWPTVRARPVAPSRSADSSARVGQSPRS